MTLTCETLINASGRGSGGRMGCLIPENPLKVLLHSMERLKPTIEIYNPAEAVMVCQFEHALRAREEVLAIDSPTIRLITRSPGEITSTTHDRRTLVDMANQTAFRRWLDLRDLGMENVANDVLFRHELGKYL